MPLTYRHTATALALGITLATGSSPADASRLAIARPSDPFAATTRDLRANGQIDAIDLHGLTARRAHQARVQGHPVRGVKRLRHGYRLLLRVGRTINTSLRPYVVVGHARVRATDGAPPLVLSLRTEDRSGTGHIDGIHMTLSEPPQLHGLASAFSVDGYQVRSATAIGDEVDLALRPNPQFDTGAQPTVHIKQLRGTNGNLAQVAALTPADGAPPVLINASTADRSGSGTLDAVDLMLSEPVIADASSLYVAGYQVVGTRDYPNGELTILLAGPGGSGDAALPAVTISPGGLRDGAGNAGAAGAIAISAGTSPVLLGARDEGFWLQGERIVTVWSAPVHAVGNGAQDFFMTAANGKPVIGTTVGPGGASNEIAVDLPTGAETPTSLAYSATPTAAVADQLGHTAQSSQTATPVAQQTPNFAGTLDSPFSRSQMMAFGQRSFYLQPWRSYIDTFPATRMLNAVGINFNVTNSNPDDVSAGARLLGDAGFTHARVGVPWNDMSYSNPSQLSPNYVPLLSNELHQLQSNGLRPLILLQSNDGIPCPEQPMSLNLTSSAPAGATSLQLDSVSAALVQPGMTGLHQYGRDGGVLITAVNSAHVATLSQPLQTALPAGATAAADLKFAPFFPEYNPDQSLNASNQATLNGWMQYVSGVTQLVKSILGNDNFDVEVWNELSFGSDFLSASNYYSSAPQGTGDTDREILQSTVSYIRSSASSLPDVGIGDGFTNEEPFTGGAAEVPGVTAIDKHPYESALKFPAAASFGGVTPLDGLGASDATSINGAWHDNYVPTFTALFPEYFLSGIQTETVTRDLAPFVSDIYGGLHGRSAHPVGAGAPQMWVTEVNADSSTVNNTLTSATGTSTSPMSSADVRHFETKAILRYLSAWVGKGTSVIDFFAAANAGNLNLIDPSFWTAAEQSHTYPGLAAGGETMIAVRRFLTSMSGAQNLSQIRPLSLNSISDYAGGYQFAGNGTAAFPPLYNRNVLGFFPFQVTPHKWVIPAYVMTRDLATRYNPSAPSTDVTRQDLPQEVFRLTIGGLDPQSTSASATDPLTGTSVPVKITGRSTNAVSLEVPLTDSPRMLTLTDG
jgi:hypothetical protein